MVDKLIVNPKSNGPVNVRSFRLIQFAPGEERVLYGLKEPQIPRLRKLGLEVYDVGEKPPVVITEPAPIPPPTPDPDEEESGEGGPTEEDFDTAVNLLLEKTRDELIEQANSLGLPAYGTKRDIASRIINEVGVDFLGT